MTNGTTQKNGTADVWPWIEYRFRGGQGDAWTSVLILAQMWGDLESDAGWKVGAA